MHKEEANNPFSCPSCFSSKEEERALPIPNYSLRSLTFSNPIFPILEEGGVRRGKENRPSQQRTFGRRAAEPEDEPEPVGRAAEDLAVAVEAGPVAGQPQVALEVGRREGRVPHAQQLVHPPGHLDHGAPVREAVERGLAVVRARPGLAHAAEGQRRYRAVHPRVVDGGAARGDSVENCGGGEVGLVKWAGYTWPI